MGEAAVRERHDGWTEARRLLFLARLAETGCVRDACRTAGLSNTSAYRARRRMPEFADRWDMALGNPRPILEQAAFDRAVHGGEVVIIRNGEEVARHRKPSDTLLRYLLERDDRRKDPKAKPWEKPGPTMDEVGEKLVRNLRAMKKGIEARERTEALAFAERMRAEGKAP